MSFQVPLNVTVLTHFPQEGGFKVLPAVQTFIPAIHQGLATKQDLPLLVSFSICPTFCGCWCMAIKRQHPQKVGHMLKETKRGKPCLVAKTRVCAAVTQQSNCNSANSLGIGQKCQTCSLWSYSIQPVGLWIDPTHCMGHALTPTPHTACNTGDNLGHVLPAPVQISVLAPGPVWIRLF